MTRHAVSPGQSLLDQSVSDPQISVAANRPDGTSQEAAQDDSPAAETVESEISRLTWAVLDGCATAEQRKRLSDLVSSQHQRRHPR